MHAGRSAAVAKVEGGARITAWNAMHAGPDIDYRMAVLAVLQMTWLRLGAYSELLRKQVESDSPGGLIGERIGSAGAEGRLYAQSEEVRALVTLEAAERNNVVKYSKVAHDMGISERLTGLAERWGDVVAGRVTALIDDLDLDEERAARVPELVMRHLGSIDMDSP